MAVPVGVGSLLATPLGKTFAQFAGSMALGKVMEWMSGPSLEGPALQQQVGIGQTLIPQLQAQAAGQPTAATQAQMGQLSQEVNRLQQSYGASATRGGMGGPVGDGGLPTASRAQQGRYQVGKVQAMGGIMGQSMISAQQQLGGLYGQGMQAQGGLELEQRQARGKFLDDFGAIYAANKLEPDLKKWLGQSGDYYNRLSIYLSNMLLPAESASVPQQPISKPQGTNPYSWMTPTTPPFKAR